MAIAALNSAATGLRALSTKIDVIANNLANAESNGFKGSRANFEDLMYTTIRNPGATNSNGEVTPAGLLVGHGVRVSNTQIDFQQGPMENTDRQLDVAINGDGLFRVKILDSVGDGTAYTRNGNFFRNNQGELVLGNKEGPRLIPQITVPDDAIDINISEDGIVEAVTSDN